MSLSACGCRFFVITHIADKRAADTEKLAEIFRQYTEKPVIVQDSVEGCMELCDIQSERQDNLLSGIVVSGGDGQSFDRGGVKC